MGTGRLPEYFRKSGTDGLASESGCSESRGARDLRNQSQQKE